jgi:hypothetical protein
LTYSDRSVSSASSRITGFSDRWRRLPVKCIKSLPAQPVDGSGVSGSTGRGRSQALESKVRFSFCRRTYYAPQFLRVCANCVIEDRRKNGGKTYWRREHQLPLAASTMWLLHHITSSCLRHDASVGLFGLLNEASRQNWRTTLGAWRHLDKRGRRKWRTTQVSAVLLSPLDHGIE